LAKSFERIHRSNLIGMGVLPLQFEDGDSAESLGLTGTETYNITGHSDAAASHADVTATTEGGETVSFRAKIRIDTPKERDYFEHGGILHYVLRQLVKAGADKAA
jgi:aconitate hydratase